jgi:hypothetical protein
MLSNLDNEVVFKKAFTDKIVFQCFVKDVLGFEVQVGKIQVAKQWDAKTQAALLQIYTIVEERFLEIQLVLPLEYWLRFATQLRYKKQPNFEAEHAKRMHYFIRVVPEPYPSNRNAPVLTTRFDPYPLPNQDRLHWNQQWVQLNPNYQASETPKRIQDWLDLIYQSMHFPENPVVNLQNTGIRQAVKRLNRAHLTIQQRTNAKKIEQSKSAWAHWQQAAVWRQNVCWVKRFHAEGQTVEELTALMQLSAEAVQDMIDLNADHYRKPFF